MNQEAIYINNEQIPQEAVLSWEYKRLKVNYKRLKRISTGAISNDFNKWQAERNIDKMREALLSIKMNLGMADLKSKLSNQYKLGNLISVIAVKLSFGRRKFSEVDFYIPKSGITIQEVASQIDDIMLINTQAHFKINLNTNPDHYVLRGMSNTIQEVLEFTGGSPLPTNFYAHYGDTEDLKSVLSKGYEEQLVGTARLANGFIIGGVRHQLKQAENGIRFKALVEFPAMLPNFMIKQHELHLACEFGRWLDEI